MEVSTRILALLFTAISFGSFAQLALSDSEVMVKSELSGKDVTAPRTDLLRTETGGFIFGPATRIKFKIVEEGSGIATTYFKIADLAFMKSDGRQMVPHQLKDGAYQIKYYSVDNSGNQEQVRMNEIYVDKTGPKISANFNSKASSFENGLPIFSGDLQLQIEAKDQHTKAQKLMYSINGGEMIVSKDAEFIDLSDVVKTLTNGLVKIEIRSYDTFYNFSKEVVEFTIKK